MQAEKVSVGTEGQYWYDMARVVLSDILYALFSESKLTREEIRKAVMAPLEDIRAMLLATGGKNGADILADPKSKHTLLVAATMIELVEKR